MKPTLTRTPSRLHNLLSFLALFLFLAAGCVPADEDAAAAGDDDSFDVDSDGDGVPDGQDSCPGFDDNEDYDDDGRPDGCATYELTDGDCLDGLDNDADGSADCADSTCSAVDECGIAGLFGSVADTSGAPLALVRVEIGGEVTITDAEGNFVFEGLETDGSPTTISFDLSGYASYFRRIVPVGNRATSAHVVMKAVDIVEIWDPSQAHQVTGSGVQLSVPANAMLDASGAPVSSNVLKVEITTGDPSDPQERKLMPGDSLGVDLEDLSLESLGFLEVSIHDPATGEEFTRIDPANPLVVDLPLSAAAQPGVVAGDSFAWKSFDEDVGEWVDEGTATVVENPGSDGIPGTVDDELSLRAELVHLSWWGATGAGSSTWGCMCVVVEDLAGNPISQVPLYQQGVTYYGADWWYARTDANGLVCTVVKNSAASAEQANLYFALGGGSEVPVPGGPFDTPTANAWPTTFWDAGFNYPVGCDDGAAPRQVLLDQSGSYYGTVIDANTGSNVGSGVTVYSSQGPTTTTDANGDYVLPMAYLDIPAKIFAGNTNSVYVTATPSNPNVQVDLTVNANEQPVLVDLMVNGISISPSPTWIGPDIYRASVPDISVPVNFDALAVDLDGGPNPISYSWEASLFCEMPVPAMACGPSNGASTTCEGQNSTQSEGCLYKLTLNDGYAGSAGTQYTIIVENL